MPPVKHYSTSEVNQYELSSRLLSLTENTSYTLTQINGQRIYRKAPYAWSGPEPSRNCEVFIGRIPHDCFEDTLVPLFQQAGELFEFRLMINFSGWNRGYAFAMYTTEGEASNAIRMFNNFMIRPSWQLGVCPSINNCRIFISRIPATTPSAEIVRLLYALTDEVQEVRIRRTVASCAAIVEYKSHRGAAMARKALVAAAAAAWGGGARPAVDWSLPQSPQLLRQYREVGRWSAERGVELCRAAEEAPPPAPSYALEPWSQARRLRMIRDAQRRPAPQWSANVESLVPNMAGLQLGGSLGGGALEAAERAVWGPPGAAPAPQPMDFNPWTARHPLQEFIATNKAECSNGFFFAQLVCVACLVTKRVSQDDEARLALLLQKLSREWSLLTSVTWDSVGGAFADAVYGGYTLITFGLILGRVFQEIPRGRRILEAFYLGVGLLCFLILGGLELAALDSVPHSLVVNASVLGSLSLVVAALFLIDLMGPRTYTATHHSQTELMSSPIPDKKLLKLTIPPPQQFVSANTEKQNGHIQEDPKKGNATTEKQNGSVNAKQNGDVNAKQNGHITQRPANLDLEKGKSEEKSLFDDHKIGYTKFEDNIDILEKSKFGSLRNIEGGNYVRLSDPLAEPDRMHYEQELAKFNEKYFRQYLESMVDGKVAVKEAYLPEPQTPVFAKVKTGKFRGFYDDPSPTYEERRSTSKSPSRVKLAPTPTLQQLEDYLKGSNNRSKRGDTPAIFPMEPIKEKDKEPGDTEGRASGTPTDPGYVQYAAGRWPDKRNLQTPRHSPT